MTPCEARNLFKEIVPVGTTLHTRTLNKSAAGNREVGVFIVTPGRNIRALGPLAARMLSHKLGKNEGVYTSECAEKIVQYLGSACYDDETAFVNEPF